MNQSNVSINFGSKMKFQLGEAGQQTFGQMTSCQTSYLAKWHHAKLHIWPNDTMPNITFGQMTLCQTLHLPVVFLPNVILSKVIEPKACSLGSIPPSCLCNEIFFFNYTLSFCKIMLIYKFYFVLISVDYSKMLLERLT